MKTPSIEKIWLLTIKNYTTHFYAKQLVLAHQPIILVRLVGGLGNQMFQYATALALGQHWQCPVKVDISYYARDKQRSYQLDQWRKAPAIAGGMALFKARASFGSYLQRLISAHRPTYTLYRQPSFRYDETLIKLPPPLFLRSGYFQSEKFFLSCEKTIRDAFQPRAPLSAQGAATMAEITAAAHPVALHVRRGDYVDRQHVHPLCDSAYYRQAVDYIKQKSANKASYFVFSDDIRAAQALLSFIPEARFVPANHVSPSADMTLMAACRDAIIANSSFSWWGAWLNPRTDKTVIAPRHWFAKAANIDNRDLIPDGWITF